MGRTQDPLNATLLSTFCLGCLSSGLSRETLCQEFHWFQALDGECALDFAPISRPIYGLFLFQLGICDITRGCRLSPPVC